MPAFKHNKRLFSEVLERGHKARAYKATRIYKATRTVQSLECKYGRCV